MKVHYAILLSLLTVLSILPICLAVETSENVAIVVSTPADAVVAAPYAKAMGYDLIYTPTNELSEDAEKDLIRGRYSKVVIVGGPVAVSEVVEDKIKDLNIKTERVWGETRVETSIEVYKVLKKEKPEIINNIVITHGFDEKILPVAVSFNAPVLYYGLKREKEVVEVLKNTRAKNAVILGKDIPKDIDRTVSKVSEKTYIASGSEEDIIKTAISYVKKINPEAKNKEAVVVYAEKAKDPIINSILHFVKGHTGMVIPLPSKDTKVLDKILSKITDAVQTISIVSNDPKIIEDISNIAKNIEFTSTQVPYEYTSEEDITGERDSRSEETPSEETPVTTPQKGPAVVVVAGGKKIEFMGQNNRTLNIIGDYTIYLPKVEAVVNVVNKKDINKDITINFSDNNSVETIIEAMNNFNVVAYNGNKVKITYYNPDMKCKNVSLHVITTRRILRDNLNNLLKGNATGLIETLNQSYRDTKTVNDSGIVEFNYTPNIAKEHIVVITEGNEVPKNAENVTVLAVGGFEVVKYNMTISITKGDVSNSVNVTINLNDTPDHDIRYGAVLINKNIRLKLEIIGNNPNNSQFNVSIVGGDKKSQIVENNDFIKLNASKVKEIIETVCSDNASAGYSETPTKETSVKLTLRNISNSYLIAIAYDTVDKKIVAIRSITNN